MSLPNEALDLIKSFEGYLKRFDNTDRVKPYLCPAGVPTIGWGNTRYPSGVRVKLSDPPIDRAAATAYLAHELQEDEEAFDRLTTRRLHPLSRGALVSFVYNCGTGAYRGSTLRRVVNSGEWSDVPEQLARWRMGGGLVLAGLVRRRKAEADLFMLGVRRYNEPEPVPVPAPVSMPVPVETKPPIAKPVEPIHGFWRRLWNRVVGR